MSNNKILAAKANELSNGEMKEISLDEKKIILAKVNDAFYAVDGVCPHYKAPLIKGALCGTRLYCPWHHSVFDITNGNLCEPPAIDGLQRYSTKVEDGNVFIQMPEEIKENKTESFTGTGNRNFVILGGGAAGLMAAQTLREKGFDGKVTMITGEDVAPYDRPALSKKYLSGKQEAEELPLRKDDFFTQHNIELIRNKQVTKADIPNQKILFEDGSSLPYDSLLIATGGEPNELSVDGASLQNVFTLRSAADAEAILQVAKKAKKACIIGASFIGTETAASLKTLGMDVTLIAKEDRLFQKNFGKEVGEVFYNLHKEKGVIIKTGAEVEKINGTEKVESVKLKSGETIEADLVIIGVGVHPKTDFISGLKQKEEDKSIITDEYLKAADNVFVAGDIASFPDARTNTNQLTRIEHWRLAQQHGRLAAQNMLGGNIPVSSLVPFFWTNQYQKRLSYVGHAKEWDEIVYDGNVAEQKFLAFYIKDKKVLAVASMNRDVESDTIEEMMRTKGAISLEEMKAILNKTEQKAVTS